MVGVLKFNLEDHDAARKFRESLNVGSVYNMLFDYREHLRQLLKYNSDNFTTEAYDAIESLQRYFHQQLDEHEITLD